MTEIEVQIHTIDENTCKRVFGNMIRQLDAGPKIGGCIYNITKIYFE